MENKPQTTQTAKKPAPRKPYKLTRKEKDSIYRDLGMTKVRGASGRIYYE